MILILITLLSALPSQQRILRIVERRPVTDYLLELTGSQFTDCGGYIPGIPEDWEQKQTAVLDCAMKAITQDIPFIFKVSYSNTDSVGIEGLVRTSKGDLLRYSYDSAPCGNPSCKESFRTFPCPNPNLYRQGGQGTWLRFRCEKP